MILKILNEIASAKGAKKVEALSLHSTNDDLREIWHLAYGTHNFFTKKIYTGRGNSLLKNCPDYDQLVDLLYVLEYRVVTGTAAKERIVEVLSNSSPEIIDIYNRIILGNLQCGIGIEAGNKVWGNDFG